jgi:putative membrane protein
MMGWFQGEWGMAGLIGMAAMVSVWGVLIGTAVWAVARCTRSEPSSTAPLESARAILDRRFAAGDVDAEEYARGRRLLETRDIHGLTPS